MSTILLTLVFRLFTDSIDMTNVGGVCGWAGPFQGDPWGELIVYPDSDSTIVFFLRASDGADDDDICTGLATSIGGNLYEYHLSDLQNDCKSSVISNLNENFMRQSNLYPDYYTIDKDTFYFKDLIDN
jgi:hypothetical protein